MNLRQSVHSFSAHLPALRFAAVAGMRTSVELWVDYQGPEPKQQVRFFVRNFNPGYSKLNDAESAKVEDSSPGCNSGMCLGANAHPGFHPGHEHGVLTGVHPACASLRH